MHNLPAIMCKCGCTWLAPACGMLSIIIIGWDCINRDSLKLFLLFRKRLENQQSC